MRILFAAKNDFSYHRTQVLIEGLKQMKGVDIELFRLEKRNRQFGEMLKQKSKGVDFVYIPPFRHKDVRWVKRYSQAPVVFDPLVSLYLTKVIDFGHWWKAPFKYFADRKSFRAADFILADTEAMRQYYHKKMGIKYENSAVLPIGFIENDFPIIEENNNNKIFKVGFYGSFVPLQGVETIVMAAHILRNYTDIHFEIVGSGYRKKQVDTLCKKLNINNISFIGWLPYQELAAKLSEFSICLGIFGKSAKADLVIPNKVYHYAAMNKAFITKKSVAITEIFVDKANVFLCEANEESLSDAILKLKNDSVLRTSLANSAYELMRNHFNESNIANDFIKKLSDFRQKTGKA